MNKQKVLDKLDEIHDVYEAAYVPSSWPSIEDLIDSISDINDIAKDIQKEVNSKVKMPKVFDEWYKANEIEDLVFDAQISELESSIGVWRLGYSSSLGDWVCDDYQQRFFMCINAIINGYEVVNNEKV